MHALMLGSGVTHKPAVLLITPVVPSPRGEGRSLRAWAWLTSLSVDHDVHVLVIGPPDQVVPYDLPAASVNVMASETSGVGRWKRRATLLLPFLVVHSGFGTEFLQVNQQVPAALGKLAQTRSLRVVVFRLYLHDVASMMLQRFPHMSMEIDLDDLESRSRWSIALCHLRLGRLTAAVREMALAVQYRVAERLLLGRYEAIYLAAREDTKCLQKRFRSRASAFPNRLSPQQQISLLKPFRVLFIGSLGYTPNQEAASFLATKIAPLLTHLPELRVTIAGRSPSPKFRQQLAGNSLIEFIENPPDLAPLYAAAAVVVIPLKAGGGTKFKTIEAFAYGRPVVSTSEGVRGLNAKAGVQYLPAETPLEFAAVISRVTTDPVLAAKVAAEGQQLWRTELSL